MMVKYAAAQRPWRRIRLVCAAKAAFLFCGRKSAAAAAAFFVPARGERGIIIVCLFYGQGD